MYYGEEMILRQIIMIYLIVLAVVLLVGLTSYILKGIGLYTLGKRRGLANAWLAFIPYGRMYFQGELCGEQKIGKGTIKNVGLWILLGNIALGVVSGLVLFFFYAVSFMKLLGSQEYYYELGDSPLVLFRFLGAVLVGYFLIIVINLVGGGLISGLRSLMNIRIYERYTDRNFAVIHAVAGLFIPLYEAIYLFLIRNREDRMGGNFRQAGPAPGMQQGFMQGQSASKRMPQSVVQTGTAAGAPVQEGRQENSPAESKAVETAPQEVEGQAPQENRGE